MCQRKHATDARRLKRRDRRWVNATRLQTNPGICSPCVPRTSLLRRRQASFTRERYASVVAFGLAPDHVSRERLAAGTES